MSGQPYDTTLTTALEPVAAALAANAYELTASLEKGSLRVAVAAGPDACEGCLISKDMMTEIITQALHDADVVQIDFKLFYPGED